MSKAEKIRRTAQAHPEWGCTRIGAVCDCSDSYVRVVLRQRAAPGGKSRHDIAWRERNMDRVRAIGRAWYHRNKAKREAAHA
jgi:hypothetical protein